MQIPMQYTTQTSMHPPIQTLVFLARSFGKHALELGNDIPKAPLYFLKAPGSVIAENQAIILPPESKDVQHEAEVAVFLKHSIYRASPNQAQDAIESWTVLNDVTARDLQKEDGQFTRAKSFDTFCPLSSVRLPSIDQENSRIQCYVNGMMKQDAPLSDMLFTPGEILSAISQVMTLRKGDLISFGTPAGVSTLKSGDLVEVRLVDPKGKLLISLQNPVIHHQKKEEI
jgi:2-keto-4-pentenoate hydratase/2-oxohepta-3-ene-1,7-dioic acid hydratase in catechol pathway